MRGAEDERQPGGLDRALPRDRITRSAWEANPSLNGYDMQPFAIHRGELVTSDDAGELAAVGRLARQGTHRRVAPPDPARLMA